MDEDILNLKVGETVRLSGVIVTARDAAHRWLVENIIHPRKPVSPEEQAIVDDLKRLLQHGVVYHCGPVVTGVETGDYRVTAAGPTTSIREEPYQAEVMRFFHLKGMIGKGGMGPTTLTACQAEPAVYFHAVGGASAVIAQTIQQVMRVHKLDFGVPEALWVWRVSQLPVIVTMDAHGASLHEQVRDRSRQALESLVIINRND
jgi:fumarate hydratase class I